MKSFKRFLTPLFTCLFGFLLLTGCGSSNNTPAQSQKDAVLAALNAARKSNNVNVLSEDDQADIIAAQIVGIAIRQYKVDSIKNSVSPSLSFIRNVIN